MSYNRNNFLTRVSEIQELVKTEQKHDRSMKWIYKNIVKQKYHISQSTFNNYMSIPAAAELKKQAN